MNKKCLLLYVLYIQLNCRYLAANYGRQNDRVCAAKSLERERPQSRSAAQKHVLESRK